MGNESPFPLFSIKTMKLIVYFPIKYANIFEKCGNSENVIKICAYFIEENTINSRFFYRKYGK